MTYIVDFEVYKGRPDLLVTRDELMHCHERTGKFSPASMTFMKKVLEFSDIGESTCVPESIALRSGEIARDSADYRSVLSISEATKETTEVMFKTIATLLERNCLRPEDIDFLVVNCSIFTPTPSLSSMIINKFKLRPDIKVFNLGGMGCSASLIGLDLIGDLLRVHRNKTGILMSTENLTSGWYLGGERSMLMQNTLFRMGGAAILLTNRPARAFLRGHRYKVEGVVRTHAGADDGAHAAVYQREDTDGFKGIELTFSLAKIAPEVLKKHFAAFGARFLPLVDKLCYLYHTKLRGEKTYVPRLMSGIDHICIHAGGKAIIQSIGEALGLSEKEIAPSKKSLHDFGNVSSASIWYTLHILENEEAQRKGDRTWLLAFGSGFKANSAVIRRLGPP